MIDDSNRPDAFLSSRIKPLKCLRRRIFDELKAQGICIWVSEVERPDLDVEQIQGIAAACLDKVVEADVLVCLIEGSYGTTESDELGGLSVLELEIALAALMGKRIIVVELRKDSQDPRILQLIKSIAPIPRVELLAESEDNVVNVLLQRLRRKELLKLWRWVFRPGHLLARLDPRRSEIEIALDGPSDASRLFPAVHPMAAPGINLPRVGKLLEQADATEDVRQRLLLLWAALRHLVATPWRSSTDVNVLLTWQRLLTGWDRATAWLGQHGDTFLSRLAAQREQRELAERLFRCGHGRDPREEDHSGASASLLYSLAKRENSLWARRRILRRALQSIDRGVDPALPGRAGSAIHTRAAIHAQLLHPRLALRDAETALRLRQESGDTPARIGEAEGTLAWALAMNLKLRRALEQARSGVQNLQAKRSSGFYVRAMRKLGVIEAANLHFRHSLDTLGKALAIAEDLNFADQTRQLRRWIRRVHIAARIIRLDWSGRP